MKSISVYELKTQFSKILKEVRQGVTFEIVSDDDGTPIARFEPVDELMAKPERKVGRSEGKMTAVSADDFKMTDEEPLRLK